MKKRLMAFWPYSYGFSKLLWGEVTSFTSEGMAKIKEYGNQTFYPTMVLPLDEGKKLAAKFKALEDDYKTSKAQFELEWDNERARRFPELVGKAFDAPKSASPQKPEAHRQLFEQGLAVMLKHHPNAEPEEIAEALDLDLNFDGTLSRRG